MPISQLPMFTQPPFLSHHPLAHGDTILFRPLFAEDGDRLDDYFSALSAESRSRFGPHPLDRTTAHELCVTHNPTETLRLVGLIDSLDTPRIIAYFILILGSTEYEPGRYTRYGITLDLAQECTVAPSIADELQSQGVGTLLMTQTIKIARQLGRKRMLLMGGTQATNQRAVHFYKKLGFVTVGEYEYPEGFLNFDMQLWL